MSISLGGRLLEPGERREHLVPIGFRPDGTPIGVPVIAMRGRADGPVLGIVTGLHGDEYEGSEAVRRILGELSPNALRGGIIATPMANISAYEVFGRTSAIDHLDLNRSFPGNPVGFLSQRVAAILVEEIVEQVSALVDLHSAGLAYDLLPYVGFNSTLGHLGERSFRLAKAFGIPHLYGSTPFPNVIRLEAVKRDIPAILVEVGGAGRCDPGGVDLVARGLLNVLRSLEMIQGTPEGLPESFTLIQAPPEGEFSHLPTGGFLRNRTWLGATVQAGEILGAMVDVFGHELASITAPIDGVVLSYRTIPVARVGEWGYSVVRIVGTADYETSMEAARGESA